MNLNTISLEIRRYINNTIHLVGNSRRNSCQFPHSSRQRFSSAHHHQPPTPLLATLVGVGSCRNANTKKICLSETWHDRRSAFWKEALERPHTPKWMRNNEGNFVSFCCWIFRWPRFYFSNSKNVTGSSQLHFTDYLLSERSRMIVPFFYRIWRYKNDGWNY